MKKPKDFYRNGWRKNGHPCKKIADRWRGPRDARGFRGVVSLAPVYRHGKEWHEEQAKKQAELDEWFYSVVFKKEDN